MSSRSKAACADWSDLPPGTPAGMSLGAVGGAKAVSPLLIVRLPPVDEVSPYVSSEIAPATVGLAQRWDGDDSVPGSFDSSNSGVRRTAVYVYDKTLSGFKESTIELLVDYQNLFSYRSIGLLGVSLATAGALANTPADTRFTHWNDQHINGALSNEAAKDFKFFGDGQYMIPLFVVTAFSGPFLEDSIPAFGPVGQWGNRSIQAMLATGPMTIFFNQALGSSRPVADEGSKWRPFHDSHGVSGHAFMGAIPFLTAASMTDNYAAKTTLFLLSFGAGWSRIHDDQHYLSEVLMGWSLAWIGVDAVNRTKSGQNDFIITPAMLAGNTPGIQFAFNF